MHPIFLKWGPFVIRSWPLFVLLGVWAAYLILEQNLKNRSIPSRSVLAFALLQVLTCFTGAALLHTWAAHRSGGYSIYGALFCAQLTVWMGWKLARWKHALSLSRFFDLHTGALAGCLFWIRIGCTLNGCCFGKPLSHWPGLVLHPEAWKYQTTPIPAPLLGLRLHPTPLYEACIFLFLLGFYFWNQYQEKIQRWHLAPGQFSWLAGMSYSISRFFIEYIRIQRPEASGAGLSINQWISIVCFLSSIVGSSILQKSRIQKASESLDVHSVLNFKALLGKIPFFSKSFFL